jgi:hypothetical protein
LPFGCIEIGAQAATDKTLRKAQIDDLVAKNTLLKSKAEGLAAEASQLRADQVKAQELFDKRQAEAGSREKNLQQRLQTALKSLRGKPRSMFDLGFVRIAFVCLLETLLLHEVVAELGAAAMMEPAGLESSIENAKGVCQEVQDLLAKARLTLDHISDNSAPESMSTNMAGVLEALSVTENGEDPLVAEVHR